MSRIDVPAGEARPVIVGEVLFDCFDDGREILGGAPFNVAWHLQAFGLKPLFISRVGEDAYGEQVRQAMDDWGMDSSGLQSDPQHPTGVVRIAMSGTEHRFDILPEQAYDHISPQAAREVLGAQPVSLLYSGSLIERSESPRQTVAALHREHPHFVDVNLRQPWWELTRVARLLQGVRWAKLNNEELALLGYPGDVAEAARRMRDDYGFAMLVITCGAEGAMLLREDGLLRGEPVAVEKLVDTVGAGDAFSAVVILGLLCGWTSFQTLQRALFFAAKQCEVQGAIRHQREFYRQCLRQWEDA